jgi:hypothetical protein
MSRSTLSNVGFLAINSFQFSTYLLSPKTQWVITSSLHQLPDDLTFFTRLSKTHQSVPSPSKFTSIWGRLRTSEHGHSTSALLQNLLRVQRRFSYTSRSTGRHDEHKFLRTAQQELPESSKHTHLLGKMNKQKPLTKSGRYQKVKPYDSKSKITLQPSFGYFLPCLAKNNSGSVCHVGLVKVMTASLITV